VYVNDASRLESERGGVLTMTALWLPMLLLFVVLVIDVGHWFVHKRHLQTQADAGALAAGVAFEKCLGDQGAANTELLATAKRYAGDPGTAGAYNAQVGAGALGTQGAVTVRVNRTAYEVGGSADTDFTDGVAPCAGGLVDVKATEAGLPLFFGGLAGFSNVFAINAHARVNIEQLGSSHAMLPVAIPQAKPKEAAVIFVNEVNHNLITSAKLTKDSVPTTLNGIQMTRWYLASPLSVDIQSKAVGVVIALSGRKIGTWTLGATLADTCDNTDLVTCYYDNTTGSYEGLVYIHGYSGSGSGSVTAPLVGDAYLTGGTCNDQSAPQFVLNGACSEGLAIKIDFGVSDPRTLHAIVKADGPGCPGSGNPKGCDLTYNPATGYFTGTGITAAGASSPAQININYQVDNVARACGGGSKCSGTIDNVQRILTARSDLSGPIQFVQADEVGSSFSPPRDSFTLGTHSFNVAIGTVGELENAQLDGDFSNDPIVNLRITKTKGSGSGSLTQSIDCDPNYNNLRDEIGNGCRPQYIANDGTDCPAYSVLWTTAQPWNCVKTQTGGAVGQVVQGMDDRILAGGTCADHPNNWPTTAGPWAPDDNDTRVMSVFLTPFGTFSGSGNAIYPVEGFATFYVTGWGHSGGGPTGCPGDTGPVPSGFIQGHFFKYIAKSVSGGGTGVGCDFGSFGSCIVTLTR
jgi:hypothetical protein